MEAIALAPGGPAEDIIASLTADDGLPRRSMRAAVESWEAVLPSFLDMLERFVRDPVAHDGDADPLFFAVHLCGQMREQRAYRPLMKLLAMKPEHVDRVLGDAVVATIDQVAASVFDGDPGPLHAVIEAKDADEFVRSRLFRALAFLTKEGRIPLEDTRSYLLRGYAELEPQGQSQVWVGWQGAISYLGLFQFKDLVRKAFANGMIGRHVMKFQHFEDDLATAFEPEAERRASPDGEHGYFGDAIEVLSRWHGFSEAARRQNGPEGARPEGKTAVSTSLDAPSGTSFGAPFVNPNRHVGRNDPCPCGSGRKYKKCCLN